MVTRIVQLNNASRKGTYVYIKKDNNRGAYYRYTPGTPLRAYEDYYDAMRTPEHQSYKTELDKATLTHTQDRTRRIDAQKRHSQRKRDQAPRIHQLFKKGVQDATLDVYSATSNDITTAYKELLEPLLHNKDQLHLARANAHKLRFDYQIEATGTTKTGQTNAHLGTITHIGAHTIEDVLAIIRQALPPATYLDSTTWMRAHNTIAGQLGTTTQKQTERDSWITKLTMKITIRRA